MTLEACPTSTAAAAADRGARRAATIAGRGGRRLRRRISPRPSPDTLPRRVPRFARRRRAASPGKRGVLRRSCSKGPSGCSKGDSCRFAHMVPEDEAARTLRVGQGRGLITPGALNSAISTAPKELTLRFFAAWGDQMNHMMIGNIWNKLGQQLRDKCDPGAWVDRRTRRAARAAAAAVGGGAAGCGRPADGQHRARRRARLLEAGELFEAVAAAAAAADARSSNRRTSPTRCGRSPRRATRRRRSSTRWQRRRWAAARLRRAEPRQHGVGVCDGGPCGAGALRRRGGGGGRAAARLQAAGARQHGVGVRDGGACGAGALRRSGGEAVTDARIARLQWPRHRAGPLRDSSRERRRRCCDALAAEAARGGAPSRRSLRRTIRRLG